MQYLMGQKDFMLWTRISSQLMTHGQYTETYM